MSEKPGEALAYVALGSNLADPVRQVQLALTALEEQAGVQLLRRSRLYRSVPWGIVDQPDFVNATAELATSLSPRALLDALLRIERAQGRRRSGERWGPRVIDLDLLLYDQLARDEPGLSLPHPRMAERPFVLAPLAELVPQMRIPGQGTVAQLLGAIDSRGCRPLGAD
ncbi:MAG TPA: 2-amino-4-hydroxy-6-hydroxymethyldihydropteridine diphosphokinase [Rhodanobacteraceae bacterium]|nr:2-amino-4-hydroxy-6-hydroxymethyldihydropteridine diphosphokinase [Rhodanobacteraceae bacterium]